MRLNRLWMRSFRCMHMQQAKLRYACECGTVCHVLCSRVVDDLIREVGSFCRRDSTCASAGVRAGSKVAARGAIAGQISSIGRGSSLGREVEGSNKKELRAVTRMRRRACY